jgi:hypothetical protein
MHFGRAGIMWRIINEMWCEALPVVAALCSVKCNSAGNEIGNFVCIRFMVNEICFAWTAVSSRFST